MIEAVFWEKESECEPNAEKCQKKECDLEICEELHNMNNTEWILDEIKSHGYAALWVDSCRFTLNASIMYDCNFSRKSCDQEELCEILEEKMEYSNTSIMNSSLSIEECNVTVNNVSAKMHECKMRKDHRNTSCDQEELCVILEEKMDNLSMSMNSSRWIEECNVTVNNVSAKMHECEMREKPENKSCDIHELCDELAEYLEGYENENFTIVTVTVEDCNVTLDQRVYQTCKKNRSCEINGLCKELVENNYNESRINTTVRVKGCSVEFNQTVIDACDIEFHHCKIEELCSKYRELAVVHSKKSFPKMVEGCKVDWNEMEQCNITFMNDTTCEVHELCHLLDDVLERYENGSAINETVSAGNCSIMVDREVYDICKNHSCELSDLCKPLRRELEMKRDWSAMMNSTIEVEMCRVTLNHAVLQECNITMKKNKSEDCSINKFCKTIRENNYNSSMVNKTIYIEECTILFDKRVVDACNIKFETFCKVEDLCPRYRALAMNHTIYSFPEYIGKCKVNMDDFDQCNVTLQELGDYYYRTFYNGFKISDSIKNVSFVAIRGADIGKQEGRWQYEHNGAWTHLDPVSPDRAIVLASSTRLR